MYQMLQLDENFAFSSYLPHNKGPKLAQSVALHGTLSICNEEGIGSFF